MNQPTENNSSPPSTWRTADSFILSAATTSLKHAYSLMPFALAERVLFGARPASYFFVDAWVLAHAALSIFAWLVASPTIAVFWQGFLLAYAFWRVLEICIYNMRQMLGAHTKIPTPNTVRSTRRSFLLALLNYGEVLLWFAAAYRVLSLSFGSNAESVGSATGSFYFSILTMATYGDITPKTTPAQWLVAGHLVISLFITLGVLARFVSLLPRPRSLDNEEGERIKGATH
jgi:hypothetical protein